MRDGLEGAGIRRDPREQGSCEKHQREHTEGRSDVGHTGSVTCDGCCAQGP